MMEEKIAALYHASGIKPGDADEMIVNTHDNCLANDGKIWPNGEGRRMANDVNALLRRRVFVAIPVAEAGRYMGMV
jgi:hypothetical protein